MTSQTTSAIEARRIAIAAQKLSGADVKPPVTRARILDTVRSMGVLQIDSVNVLARAHYLPLFARLGTYDRAELDRCASDPPRGLYEYWTHMASFAPVESQPLMRWRMERAVEGKGTYGRIARFAKEKRVYLKRVLAEIAARGPLAASDLGQEKTKEKGWWVWSEAKVAVETLFWQGRLSAAARRTGFERLYDLPERVLPAEVLAMPTPTEKDAHRALVAIAGSALGIATEDDLADYFRLTRTETKPRIADLVDAGTLIPTKVEGWKGGAWRHRDCVSAEGSASALLAPFDPLIWFRPRALRLFGFHYRIGIYTPAHQRTHGYYVLPFLLGDELVARVDLKAERAAKTLLVQSAHIEEGRVAADIAPALAAELSRMAAWLGMNDVKVSRKGPLAAALRSEIKKVV